MNKGILISSLVLSLLTLASVQATAQEGGKIHVGNLKIIPGLTVQEIYDDNIYLGNGTNNTSELEESDWITHFMPSLIFDYTFPERGSLRLGYQGDLAYYSGNDINDWKTHKGFFALDYQAPGGLILGVNNVYTDAEDPYGSLNDYNLGVPNSERWTNDLKSKLGYTFSNRFKILGYYNFYKQDYEEVVDYTQDHYDNEFGAGFQMRLLPKTWGFIRYHYGEREYFTHPAGTGSNERNDSDYNWHRANAGLTWDSGAKLSGEVNFGFQWRDYDNATDINGNRYDDRDTWIASTAVNYNATSTTIISLNIARAVRDSDSNTNQYYEDTSIGAFLRQTLLNKFTLFAGFTYANYDYNLPVNRSRDDDNFMANLKLDYQIQDWLKAGAGYTYNKRDSNYEVNSFTDNQFMISLSGMY